MTRSLSAAYDDLLPKRWHLRVEDDGRLGATLIGSDPPVVVYADSLAGLRKQVTTAMRRARQAA